MQKSGENSNLENTVSTAIITSFSSQFNSQDIQGVQK